MSKGAETPKEIVRSKFPRSYCIRNRKTGGYAVHSEATTHKRILGRAVTPALAWKLALARNLRRKVCEGAI